MATLDKRLPIDIENRFYVMMFKICYQTLRAFTLGEFPLACGYRDDTKHALSIDRSLEVLA